ncbi:MULTISPECIES: PNPOx family protein [Sphingobium]|nr:MULTISPECIES: flavin reductase family protein [Sphingobium]MBJ7377982.1 flavin reductase family protein [Sphingobium sp.]
MMQPSTYRADFVQVMRHMTGTVAIVARAQRDDRTGLATIADDASTADPLILLACVNRTACADALIVQMAVFSVNVVTASVAKIVALCSAHHRCGVQMPWKPNKSTRRD